MRHSSPRFLAALVLSSASLGAVSARADGPSAPPTAEDKPGAAALFAEAGRLVDAGQPAAACPKYEESLRLYDGLNTRYFLADCYARVGRMASAWALFSEVAVRAAAVGDTAKETWARDRAAAVRPKVSFLTIAPGTPRAEGMEVTRDGEAVGPAQWGAPMPVDPGEHAIGASAPGKRSWSGRVQVLPDGASARVEVPPLEDGDAGAPRGVAAGVEAPRDAAGGRRTLALVLGGAGVVGLGVGTALAFAAKGTFDDARVDCNGDRCTQRGIDGRSSAVAQANVATVVFGAGLAGVAAGVVLWLTAPHATGGASVGLTPTLGGAALRGSF